MPNINQNAKNTETLRILMAHNHYQKLGGEDQSFFAESKLLADFGHEVVQYALRNDNIRKSKMILTAINAIWSRSSAQEIFNLVQRHNIQVAHFQNIFPQISPSAYYAARRGGAAVVQALRNYRMTCVNGLLYRDGNICELCVGQFTAIQGIHHRCYRDSAVASAVVTGTVATHKLLRTYHRQVDLFIAVSDFVKKKYVESGFDATQIVVKPNVIARDPGVGDGQGGYALYVGRLTQEKGILTLLTAWSSGALSLPLKIIGEGPLLSEVERYVSQIECIEYLGQLPLKETYDAIGRANVLIVPSEWNEPFGRVVIEAFAKGTPVVASATGGLTELVTPGKTGEVFQAGDVEDLILHTNRLISSTEHLAIMRKSSRQEYLDKYTPEKNHQLLMSIYEEALRRRRN